MKRKAIALICAAALAALSLTGCGNKEADDKLIKVAASAVPHAAILEQVKPILEAQGYTLEVTVFSDYVQPNKVVDSGDFDANYFQHITYMNDFNSQQGTHLANAGNIHYEPMGIYAGTESDLDNIPDKAAIAVPNDTTNEARALVLLQEKGLIKLAEDAGFNATVNDIEENPHNLSFVELEAAQIPRILNEVSYAVINGNYALEAGLKVQEDSLYYESDQSAAAKAYVNVVAVKEGNENLPKIKALVDALRSEEMRNYIDDTYQGSVVIYEE